MNRKIFVALSISTLFLSLTAALRAAEFDRQSYVDSVVTVLRIHVDTLENLTAHKIKYSDNLVRHAIAIEQTFGLLGPMDWHAAESAKLMRKHPADMDAEKFEKMGKASRLAMKNLIIAAHRAMEEDNREGIKQALQDMKHSCEACHAYLPATAVPDVWGTLHRK